MKKMITLFKKDLTDLSRVTRVFNEENSWVLTKGIATRKFDGTAVMVKDGEIWKRYDVKHGRKVPDGAIACQEPDKITGHHPHWVKCSENNTNDKWHIQALKQYDFVLADGTYELCGPHFNGNPEKFDTDVLVKHGGDQFADFDISKANDYDYVMQFLNNYDIEGLVFHEKNGDRFCKIRKCDFGLNR